MRYKIDVLKEMLRDDPSFQVYPMSGAYQLSMIL